jgi:putative ABC transport system permease protein
MVNFPLFKKLGRDLWQRKLTIVAILAVIAIGVGSYTGMSGVYYDLKTASNNYYQQYHLADFSLDLKSAPVTLTKNLTDLPNILRLQPRVKTDTMVSFVGGAYVPGTALSLPENSAAINSIKLITGTMASSDYAREVILEHQFAQAWHLKVGNHITVRLPDGEHNMLIVGTALSPENVVLLAPGSIVPDPKSFAIVFVPEKFLQQTTNLNSSFNELLGLARNKDPIAVKNTLTLLNAKLDNYGVQLQTLRDEEVSAEVLKDELINIKKISVLLPSMFLAVAALVLNVMIMRLVAQQRVIIGTLKAMGYSSLMVIRHYMAYSMFIGFIGGLTGLGAGFIFQYLVLLQYRTYFIIPHMDFGIHVNILCYGMLISLGSALVGAIFGAAKTASLKPAEAMRPPAPKKESHIFLERFAVFWKKLSFQGKSISRVILRNKIRSLVTIASSMMATTLIFGSFALVDSIYAMIDYSYAKIQHQDYTLTLREPLGSDIERTILTQTAPKVVKMEGQLNIPVNLANGPFSKRLEITGLPSDNELYTPLDTNNKKIKIDATGLVINKTLADILQVKVGESVIMRPLLGNRQQTTVQIRQIITNYMGLSAYADKTWLSKLIGDSDLTSSYLFKTENANEAELASIVAKFAPTINLFSVQDQSALLKKSMDQYLVFMAMVLIVCAGIIAIGSIINTAIISLNEQERDVATLRVLGFTNFQVAKIFFGESIILNIFGAAIGLLTGIYFAYYISIFFSTELYRMPMVIYPERMLLTLGIMFSFVLLSQVMIYNIVKKTQWLVVLNARE